MTASFGTPVVVILFNRPARVRELIAVLRRIRPARILAVADGPRDTHPGDRKACAAARAELDGIDWPCTIEREFAPANLGMDLRVVSGLDWAFSRAERAIVLEDDVLPHPSFLRWAADMLDRFGDDPQVTMVSGRNPLGRWGDGASDHVRTRWGSCWGWAATARAWRQVSAVELGGNPAAALDDALRAGTDELLTQHFGLALRDYREGAHLCWDAVLALRGFLRGGTAIVPPVNLIRNNGFGPDATNTRDPHDLNALIPVGAAPAAVDSGASVPDDGFDRAAVLLHLMSQWADPTMCRRLAAGLLPGSTLPLDDHVQHALAPFAVPDESLNLLEHLAAQGVSSPHFDVLMSSMRDAALTPSGRA